MNETTKKCKCGNFATPGRGDYCTDCYFDAFDEALECRPIHPPTDKNEWSEKYAIVLEMANMPVLGSFIANFNKPYRIPFGKENMAFNLLNKKGNMVVIADKKTLLENPFDLCEADFNEARDLPVEGTEQLSLEDSIKNAEEIELL